MKQIYCAIHGLQNNASDQHKENMDECTASDLAWEPAEAINPLLAERDHYLSPNATIICSAPPA